MDMSFFGSKIVTSFCLYCIIAHFIERGNETEKARDNGRLNVYMS